MKVRAMVTARSNVETDLTTLALIDTGVTIGLPQNLILAWFVQPPVVGYGVMT